MEGYNRLVMGLALPALAAFLVGASPAWAQMSVESG
jgi:hypothetical protein